MVAPNARRLDGTVAEDIRFAHAALDKLSGGNVVGGISCHSTYRQDAPFSSSFTVYPFGVRRSPFHIVLVLVLETSALSMRRAMRPAPGGEPLYPVASPSRKSRGNKSGIA